MRQIIIAFVFFTACNNNKQASQQTSTDSSTTISQKNSADTTNSYKNIWVDRLNGEKYSLPDTISGKHVSFYLNNPKVASIAKALYNGKFRPTDNDSTTKLLSYVITDDNTIRPFYRWCLDFTIAISDGALGEYPGSPALAYATKFPKEFFDYMDKDTSGQRYKQWTEIIAYNGLNDYNKKKSEIEKEIISKMLLKCPSCEEEEKKLIKTFAKDISQGIKLQN